MPRETEFRRLRTDGGQVLIATRVFDAYWGFAAARQRVFQGRVAGRPPPWTEDPVLAEHRFTNAYRASDRVSQYLIRNVIYAHEQSREEVFFRVLLFKLFNRIETWELLVDALGEAPSWRAFDVERLAGILDTRMATGRRVYSGAYIMPSPRLGSRRKHKNHLRLLEMMMADRMPARVQAAGSLEEVFKLLRSYPSFGDFLAFQFAIDLNYSELIDFSEMEFVVAGPGARDGLRKCFVDAGGLTDADLIAHVASIADDEFARQGLTFQKLGGERSLQLIDCQNLFCEIDKYARVAHPEFSGSSGRTRIKQKFKQNPAPLPQFYPPKWGLAAASGGADRVHSNRGGADVEQLALEGTYS